MLSKIQGLRFPDEYVIKFFFKHNLHKVKKTVLECGCGDGNNLMLFREFGWNVIGIDHDKKSLHNAEVNLKQIRKNKKIRLIHQDLSADISPETKKLSCSLDVILLPNVLYYLNRESAKKLLIYLRNIVKPRGLIFSRTRTTKDYRYGKGLKTERNGYILQIKETGEAGLLNVFYPRSEIQKMLKDYLGLDPQTATALKVINENVQCGKKIINQDTVIWGQTVERKY
jgi:SAM-dependent methyltransferase